MSNEDDSFERVRIHGGTAEATRVLAIADAELTRRQNTPIDSDEPRERERWGQSIVLYVENPVGLDDTDRARLDRLTREGRQHAVLITLRGNGRPAARWPVQVPIPERFDPPLVGASVETIKDQVAAIMAELDSRDDIKENR